MSVESEVAQIFEGKLVGVVYVDSGKDYVLKGKITKVTDQAVLLSSMKYGKTLVSLNSIKKIFELDGGNGNASE